MTTDTLTSELDVLLSEPLVQVKRRTAAALDRLLERTGRRVVLFGAGGLGRQTLACLRTIGVEPLAFSDNNRTLWDTAIDGVSVCAPSEAARRFGREALFLVTIWNPHHWYQDSRQQLSALGCRQVAPASSIYWRFPDTFLPFFAQDRPEHTYRHADAIVRAGALWHDPESKRQFLQHIRRQTHGVWEFTPPRPEDQESYFLPTVFRPDANDVFVDCGAFDGDTLRAFLAWTRLEFDHVVALEPDPISRERLTTYVAALPADVRERITCAPFAVGADRRLLNFAATGGVGSKAAEGGSATVQQTTLDELIGRERNVTFIKMDIEGAELEALRGGRTVIERDGPMLAVCVYHTPQDIWTIPLLMREMLPEHQLFLRGHEGDGWQAVAYAVPPHRLVSGLRA